MKVFGGTQNKPELCVKGATSGLDCEVNWIQTHFLGNHKVKINMECCVQNSYSEGLHLAGNQECVLCIKVTQSLKARVGCFILTDNISNSKCLEVYNFPDQGFLVNLKATDFQGSHYDILQLYRVLRRNTVSYQLCSSLYLCLLS